jgi:hypothetical protein
VGLDDVSAPTTVRGKLAAILPIPAFLRRGDGAGVVSGPGGAPGFAAQMSSSLGAMADPVAATWTKAVAAAAALAFAGAGAHVAAQNGHPVPGLGHLPLVGAKHSGKVKAVPAKARFGIADSVTLRSERTGAVGSSKTASAGKAGTTPAAAREAAGRGDDGSAGVTLPAASAPAAPGAPDPGVSLPDVGSPNTSGDAPDPSSAGGPGAQTKIPSVPPVDAGGSAPSTPSTPAPPSGLPSVRSAVSSAVGGAG